MDAAARHRRRRLAGLLALALCGGCATPRPPPGQPKVVGLEIEGARQLPEGDIKERIVTTETPWWEPLWPFVAPSYFDENAWQADLRRIERLYQARGFYQAEVERLPKEEEQQREGNQVALKVRVREGAPTRVESFKDSGLEEVPAALRAQALAELPLREGGVLREEAWEATKQLVRERLRELGYAEAEVGGEVRVDVDTRQARVELRARPGQRYRFGDIFVATDANPQVSPRRVIAQARVEVQKDAWYSESALAEAQARVFRMGVFGAVKVNRGAPDREAGRVPVVVDVRESPFRSVRLGLGLGLDPARNEARLVGEWSHRNFMGGLRRLTIGGRAGYAFLPGFYAAVIQRRDDAQDGPVLDLTTEFEQPQFLFRDVRLQTSLTLERGLEQAYSFLGGRLRGGLVWQPLPHVSIFPTYNLEVYRLNGTAGTDERVPPITLGCDGRTECDVALSYTELVGEWDRRDETLAPSRGYYASLSLQGGGGPLLGSYEFVRLLPDARYYLTFGERQRFTVAARLRAGLLLSPGGFQGTSIVSRFFSGGPLMRGFNSRRLAPQVAVGTEGETVPVGGNSLFESALEVRWRASELFVLSAFHDSGFVGQGSLWPGDGGLLGPHHYHALGLGLRLVTPVGPLRLDVARRLNIGAPLPNAAGGPEFTGEPSCFGLFKGPRQAYAGAPEGLCTFHISVGEAF